MKLTNYKIINNYCASINLIDHQPPLTVHGIWALGTHTIHEQGTMNQGVMG